MELEFYCKKGSKRPFTAYSTDFIFMYKRLERYYIRFPLSYTDGIFEYFYRRVSYHDYYGEFKNAYHRIEGSMQIKLLNKILKVINEHIKHQKSLAKL